MLDIKFIRENKDIVMAGIKKKRSDVDIDALLNLDEKRLAVMASTEALRSEQNKMNNSIAIEKNDAVRQQMISEMKIVKDEYKQKEDELSAIMTEWQALMLKIPNIPSVDTPEGPDESGNQVIRQWGEKPVFSFTPKEHFELPPQIPL